MMADGGNNEVGEWKEKRARKRLEREEASVVVDWLGDVKSEKMVSNVGKATKQSNNKISRGGRIVVYSGSSPQRC